MKFLNYLNEALPLKIAKQYTAMYNRKKYDKQFGGKNRIYLELGAIEADVRTSKNKKLVSGVLYYLGYEILDYNAGLAKKKGTDEKRGIIKIGKILSNVEYFIKAGYPESEQEEVYKNFINDPVRAASKKIDLMVVISRHPYDLAGMSTDRGWTSCMTLDSAGGSIDSYIKKEIEGGSIIAYLIDKNDPNINKPIGRILIKPFINPLNNKVMMVPCTRGYGTTPQEFIDAVIKWTNEAFNKNLPAGAYNISSDVYGGDYSVPAVLHPGAEIKTINDYIKGSKEFRFRVHNRKNFREVIKQQNFRDSLTIKSLLKLAKKLYVERINAFELILEMLSQKPELLNTEEGKIFFVWCVFYNTYQLPGHTKMIIRTNAKGELKNPESAFSVDRLKVYLISKIIQYQQNLAISSWTSNLPLIMPKNIYDKALDRLFSYYEKDKEPWYP